MQLNEASILIVDDEPVLLDIMAEWFKQVAGRVFGAADGEQALGVVAAHKVDLIITDVRMPAMDGVTLLKKLKARGFRTPSLIFITGFADIEAREAYDLGAEALLEKPIERDELVGVARRSLSAPGERWGKPLDLEAKLVLRRRFRDLATALREHEIAFGRGGFCIEGNDALPSSPFRVELDFRSDGFVLSGQGVARWLADHENQIGVELTYVAEPSRARALELMADAASFIPRSTGRRYQALAG